MDDTANICARAAFFGSGVYANCMTALRVIKGISSTREALTLFLSDSKEKAFQFVISDSARQLLPWLLLLMAIYGYVLPDWVRLQTVSALSSVLHALGYPLRLLSYYRWKLASVKKVKFAAAQKPGYFRDGDEMYLRTPSQEVFKLIPKFSQYVNEDKGFEGGFKTIYEHQQVSALESVIEGSNVYDAEIPKEVVVLGTVSDRAGESLFTEIAMGFRFADYLITALHAFDSVNWEDIAILNPKTGKCVKMTEIVGKKEFFSHKEYDPGTGSDICALALPKDFWCGIQVASLKVTGFTRAAKGRTRLYFWDRTEKSSKVSDGNLTSPSYEHKMRGVIPHSCTSYKGCSGAPIWIRLNGANKICGMHILGKFGKEKTNFATSVPDILHFLKMIGALEKKPEKTEKQLATESTQEAESQYDRYAHPEDGDEDHYFYDVDAAHEEWERKMDERMDRMEERQNEDDQDKDEDEDPNRLAELGHEDEMTMVHGSIEDKYSASTVGKRAGRRTRWADLDDLERGSKVNKAVECFIEEDGSDGSSSEKVGGNIAAQVVRALSNGLAEYGLAASPGVGIAPELMRGLRAAIEEDETLQRTRLRNHLAGAPVTVATKLFEFLDLDEEYLMEIANGDAVHRSLIKALIAKQNEFNDYNKCVASADEEIEKDFDLLKRLLPEDMYENGTVPTGESYSFLNVILDRINDTIDERIKYNMVPKSRRGDSEYHPIWGTTPLQYRDVNEDLSSAIAVRDSPLESVTLDTAPETKQAPGVSVAPLEVPVVPQRFVRDGDEIVVLPPRPPTPPLPHRDVRPVSEPPGLPRPTAPPVIYGPSAATADLQTPEQMETIPEDEEGYEDVVPDLNLPDEQVELPKLSTTPLQDERRGRFATAGTAVPKYNAEDEVNRVDVDALLKEDNPGKWNLSGWTPAALLATAAFATYRQYMSSADLEFFDDPATLVTNSETHEVMARQVGKFSGSHNPGKKRKAITQEQIDRCKKMGLEMSQFVIPAGSVNELEDSLRAQLSVAKCLGPSFSNERREKVMKYIYKRFLSRVPTRTAHFLNVRENVYNVVNTLDGSKSTGWSSHFLSGQKNAWQTPDGVAKLTYLVKCRLLLRLLWGKDGMNDMTPVEMLKFGLSDPLCAFLKAEPHPPKKVENNRWRVIWSSSIVDAMCCAMTHRHQDKVEISAYQSGHVQTYHTLGMGHHDEGIERVGQDIERIQAHGLIQDEDASAWDFSVQRSWLYRDTLRRCYQYRGPFRATFEELAWCEGASNTAHVIAYGNKVVEVLKAGITASGVLSTSAQNSFMRADLAFLSGATDAVANGDDLIASGLDPKLIAKAGYTSKGLQVATSHDDPVSFTSHNFFREGGKWCAKYLNFEKLFARLLLAGKCPTNEMLCGCLFVIRNSQAQKELFAKLCCEFGWDTDNVQAIDHDMSSW